MNEWKLEKIEELHRNKKKKKKVSEQRNAGPKQLFPTSPVFAHVALFITFVSVGVCANLINH